MRYLLNINKKVIYILVALALATPILLKINLSPVPMQPAEELFKVLQNLPDKSERPVVIALDWEPGTKAENGPQSKLVMEHLFRKRVPFILMTLAQRASPILKELPLEVIEILKKELPNENWEYGKDWVNLGFQANGGLAIQAFARAEDIHKVIKTDFKGTPIKEIEVMKNVKKLHDISLLVQITSLVGTFNAWLQFFRVDSYVPPMLHGCTSISIPEAYIYYNSKQILGFFEGVAGAAWYDKLLNKIYPKREEQATAINTGLAIAQMVILFFILLGNISYIVERRKK